MKTYWDKLIDRHNKWSNGTSRSRKFLEMIYGAPYKVGNFDRALKPGEKEKDSDAELLAEINLAWKGACDEDADMQWVRRHGLLLQLLFGLFFVVQIAWAIKTGGDARFYAGVVSVYACVLLYNWGTIGTLERVLTSTLLVVVNIAVLALAYGTTTWFFPYFALIYVPLWVWYGCKISRWKNKAERKILAQLQTKFKMKLHFD